MEVKAGFIILGILILITGLSALVVYRPRDERNPETLGIDPFWTGWVAVFASLTAGIALGVLSGTMGHLIVLRFMRHSISVVHWSNVAFGVLCIIFSVSGTIGTWEKAFSTALVATGNGGVPKFLKERLYSFFFKEGAHKLPWFMSSQDVDMTLQIGNQLDFEEPSKDHSMVGISLFWEYRIDRPARSLSIGPIAKINSTYDKLAKTGARTYVRGYDTDDLLRKAVPPAIPPAPRPHCDQMERDIKAELLQFSKRFVDENSIRIKVEELLPPKADVEAAGEARAATRKNERDMIAITGFNARLKAIRDAHPELDAKGAAILLQTQESKLSRSAFIFEDLEGSVDKFTQGVGAFLRGMAEDVAERATKKEIA